MKRDVIIINGKRYEIETFYQHYLEIFSELSMQYMNSQERIRKNPRDWKKRGRKATIKSDSLKLYENIIIYPYYCDFHHISNNKDCSQGVFFEKDKKFFLIVNHYEYSGHYLCLEKAISYDVVTFVRKYYTSVSESITNTNIKQLFKNGINLFFDRERISPGRSYHEIFLEEEKENYIIRITHKTMIIQNPSICDEYFFRVRKRDFSIK